MHVKKGDTVRILLGKDRGKSGKILSLNTKKNSAVVEGLNLYYRHERPKKSGQKGQKLRLPMPVNMSNLMLIDPTSKKPTRTSMAVDEKGVKQRVSKKSKKVIK